jgi:hypothetical protein
VGGTFTGASNSMSSNEASLFDGVAGQAYDACYHRACDTLDNVDFDVLAEMTIAASAVLSRVLNDDGQTSRRRVASAAVMEVEPILVGGCQDAHRLDHE